MGRIHVFWILLIGVLVPRDGGLFSQVEQLNWVGQVNAESSPLPGASVVAYNETEGAVLSFAISEDDGRFTLKLPKGLDSFWLEITHLAYDPVKEWVIIGQANRSWELAERSVKLPSLTVTQPVMQRRGDTLVFDFTQLREDNDNTIEDVLKRIPGISVTASGLIRYQGLEISKFYIEGLDLLEGRYALATRYLDPGAIRDVEVLEEHQPIRALDSLVRPPNAALNLRLKSGVTLSATAEGGIGGTPAMARLRSDVFSFSPKRQANVLLAGNNTGANDGSAFRDFYTNRNNETALVSSNTPLPPPFLIPSEEYRDNLSGAGAFNLLNKLSEHDQLKIGAFLNGERLKYRGANELSFFDAERTSLLTEELFKQEEVLLANARLIYEKNAPSLYWKTTLQHEWRGEMSVSRGDINERETAANQRTDSHDLYAFTNLIIRKGDRAREVSGRFEQRTIADSFRVAPISVFTDLGTLSAAVARQGVERRVREVEALTQYYLRWGKMTGQIELTGQFRTDRLTTNLDFIDDASGNTTAFANGTRQRRLTFAASPRLRRETDKYVFSVKAPVGMHGVALREAAEPDVRRELLYLEPSVSYARKLPKARGLSATLTYHNDYDRDRILFSDYLLRSERTLERRVFQLNRYQKYEGQFRFTGPLFSGKFQYESFLLAALNQRNFVDATGFSTQGAVVEQLTGRSTLRNLAWTHSLSTFLWRSIDVKIKYSHQLASVPLMSNGTTSRVNNGVNSWNLRLSKVFNRQVITLVGNWDQQRNILLPNKLNEWYTRLAFFQQLGRKKTDLQFNVQHFYATTGTVRAHNWLMDLRLRTPVFGGKYQLIAHLRNLTATEEFTSLGLYAFSAQVSRFRLRPRQLWIGIKRVF